MSGPLGLCVRSLLAASFVVGQVIALSTSAANQDFTEWKSGRGEWTDAARWSDGLPNPFERTEIHGDSTVLVPVGTYLAGDLEVGLHAGDHSRVEIDGGQLILMQDSLRLGEDSGGAGELFMKSGALHSSMDIYVGAANSVPGRATKGTLTIEGGSFVGRTLLVGNGWAAESRIHIESSKPSAIHFLDYVYIQAFADQEGRPGNTTLAFTLDDHGVTPITIQSHRDGLRIVKDKNCHCRLEITLGAVPPRDDVTLVAGHVPIVGTFDDLPEGSEVAAQFAGHTYRWRLTYQGGESGHDLVLKNTSEYVADAPTTHTRPIPEPPAPLWRDHPLYPLSITPGEPAFTGAEGYGAYTPGGRGGQALYVDNLNDSGPGSLRAAIETTGPRTITFRTGGVIPLKSTLGITEPFITIDGQTAPGPGIMLRNHGIEVRTHDVVLRYFRVRVGDDAVDVKDIRAAEGGAGEHALYFIDGSKNGIADHLSLSWSTTKVLSVTKLSDLITIQWCILSEGLNYAGHGFCSLAGGNRVTWHHNLIAHNVSRNVRFQGLVDADFRNNVVYDWGQKACYGEFDRVNFVGNYYKAGPSTYQKPYLLFHDGKAVVMPGSLYVAKNILEGAGAAPGVNEDNWRGIGYYYERNTIAAKEPFPAPPVTTESPETAYESVLKNAGASLPTRDSVDARVVKEVRDGIGHLVNSVAEAGGWTEFSSTMSTGSQP
ncbi:MAG TPA: hypothetical protein VGM76_00840 [Lacipirellulaceae bacterium]|jgi:pectate lyase